MSRLCVKLKLNLCVLGHLSVIVEVPQVQVAHSIHTCKHSGVSRRPHDIINVIRVIFKGVQRLIVLRKWFSEVLCPKTLYAVACSCYQKHQMRRNFTNAASFPPILGKHIRIRVTQHKIHRVFHHRPTITHTTLQSPKKQDIIFNNK